MNVLAIAAHPDDVDISCSGTLVKYRKQGHSIFIIVTTSGNMGHNGFNRDELSKIRKKEQSNSAEIIGAKIRFLGFDDQELIDTPEVRRSFINSIRWANPDVILTHYPDDNSADHAMTGKIVGNILLSLPWKNALVDEVPMKKAPSVFYWDTNGGIGFNPEAYVDISEDMETKRNALAQHKSQIELAVDYMNVIEIVSAFRGLQAGYKYAEAFIGHKVFEYMPDYKLLP